MPDIPTARSYVAVALVAAVVAAALAWWWWWTPVTRVVLVRHAEKSGPEENADLTPAGVARAEALAAALDRALPAAVYATEFCRTVRSAQPTALAAGVPVQIFEVRNGVPGIADCDPAIAAATGSLAPGGEWDESLAERILAEHRGQRVVVVSHNSTTLDLLEALTGESACPSVFAAHPQAGCVIPEDEYDHVFLVEVPRFGAPAWMHFRY